VTWHRVTSRVEEKETPGALRLTGYFVPTLSAILKSNFAPVGDTATTRRAFSQRTFISYCSGFSLEVCRPDSVDLRGRSGGSVFLSTTSGSRIGQRVHAFHPKFDGVLVPNQPASCPVPESRQHPAGRPDAAFRISTSRREIAPAGSRRRCPAFRAPNEHAPSPPPSTAGHSPYISPADGGGPGPGATCEPGASVSCARRPASRGGAIGREKSARTRVVREPPTFPGGFESPVRGRAAPCGLGRCARGPRA